jgi:RNA polymerase sigma factor (TIGR02999 family)
LGSNVEKDVTTLLTEWRRGNRGALDALTPLVYEQLRSLAARALRREAPGHTLQTTALAHEAYLKLIDQSRVEWHDREHFFAVAATMIRRILVTHARRRYAVKRGGMQQPVSLDEAVALVPGIRVEILALDAALENLSKMDPQQGRIVELRFFGGLSIEETSRVLAISTATVNREWNLARAWLHRELTGRNEASRHRDWFNG